MRAILLFVSAGACVAAGAFGCSSSSSGAGGSGGGAASSSASSSSAAVSSSSASGSSGSGGGMSAGMICNTCAGNTFTTNMMCKMAVDTCMADPDCAKWEMCTSACLTEDPPTTQCFAACDQAESVVANLYQPIYDCICDVATCKAECSFACP